MRRLILFVGAVLAGVALAGAFAGAGVVEDPDARTADGVSCMADRGLDASALEFMASDEFAGYNSNATNDLSRIEDLVPSLDGRTADPADIHAALEACLDELKETSEVSSPKEVAISADERAEMTSCLESGHLGLVAAEITKRDNGTWSIRYQHGGDLPDDEVKALDAAAPACVVQHTDAN